MVRTRQSIAGMGWVLAVLAAMAPGPASADTFGTGGNQFTINFATISSATNPTSGYGIVNNNYRIGTLEITNDQWNKFAAGLGVSVTGSPWYAYDPTVTPFFTGTTQPMNSVSWYQAAQFVNWLNTSTGHQAAYKFTGTQGTSGYTFTTWSPSEAAGGTNLFRHKDAFYYLPTEDEWVKAAYWNGSSLQTYATVGNVAPTQGNGSGGTGWNYYSNGYATTTPGPWAAGSGSQELNGTYDMMGNAWEWLESPATSGNYGVGASRGMRGGSYASDSTALTSSARGSTVNPPLSGDPATGYGADIGFRIASVVPVLPLTWTGSVNNVWDVNTTANFSGRTPGVFLNGDQVVFDDTGSNPAIAVAAGGVAPNGVTFANTLAKDYSLSGGPIQGTTGVLVSGGGRVTLSGPNSYTGGTTISNGTLSAGSLVVSGGTSNLGNAASAVVLGDVSTQGTLSYTGGAGGFTRGLTINAGGGQLTNAGSGLLTVSSGGIAAAGLFTVGGSQDIGISSVISGGGGLNKTGTDTVTLSGANSYTGGTTVAAGTLSAASLVVSGGTSSLGNAASAVVLGDASSQGTLSYSGGAISYTRGFTVNAGGGQLANAGSGLLTVSTGGINAGGTFGVGGSQDVSVSSVISGNGGVNKIGADTVTLSAANTYTGGTSISGGTLSAANLVVSGGTSNLGNAASAVVLGDGANQGTLSYTGGAISYTRGFSVNPGGGQVVNAGSGLLTIATGGIAASGPFSVGGAAQNVTISSVISGSGGLAKIGADTLTITGANTYNGGTTISGGTLSAASLVVSGGTSNLGNAASAVVLGDASNQATLSYTGGAANYTRGFTINAGGGQLTNAGTGLLTVSSGAISTAGLFNLGTTSQSITISSAISGGGGLNKTGAYTLTLSGASSYTGGTTINAGTLSAAALAISGGTSSLGNAASAVVLGDASNQGTLSYTGGAANYTRGFTINAGGGRLTNAGSGLLTVSGGGINAGGLFTVNPSSQDIGISSAISGVGGLTKTGAYTSTLSGANSYTGGTTITAGTLSANNIVVSGGTSGLGNAATAVVLGNASNQGTLSYTGGAANYTRGLTINAGGGQLANAGTGLLTVSSGGISAGGTFTVNAAAQDLGISSVIGSTGGVNKTGSGTATLSAANTYTGGTTVAAGTLSAASLVVSGGTSSLGNAATAVVLGDAANQGTLSYTGGAANYTRGFTINAGGGQLTNAGTGLLTVSSGGITDNSLFTVGGASQDISISSVISGSGGLVKTGANTLTLSGANSYNGGTTVSGGTLSAANIVVSGSTSNLGYATSPVVLGDGSNQGTLSYTGGAANYTRGFTVNAGGGQLTNAGSGLLTISSGGISTSGVFAVGGASQDVTIASAISGSGGLNKTGADTLTLTSASSYTGGVSAGAGTLALNHADAIPVPAATTGQNLYVGNGAQVVLATGLPKAVQVRGLAMYGGTSPTGTIDLKNGQLVVDSTVSPVATVAAQIASGYNPADPDNPWQGPGITSSSAAADAAKYAVGYVLNGDLSELAWGTWFGRTVNNDSVLVRYTYQGDADLSGEVTTDDFDNWKQGYVTHLSGWLHGDLDYSGDITTDDFDLWKQVYVGHYAPLGDGSGGGSVATSAVPEPCSLVLLGLGAIGLLGRRRKRG